MIAPSDSVSTDAVERLQRYSRFVALVAEQLDAMREDDGERLRRLGEERVSIERELADQSAPHSADHTDEADAELAGPDDTLAGLHQELWQALATLEERFDADRHTEEQMALLSNGAIRWARSMPAVRLNGRPYPDLEQRTSHLDRRF